jgi:hypothetical protein
MESARITRLLAATRNQEVQQAILRQKSLCCPPQIQTTNTMIANEGAVEEARSDVNTWGVTFPQATVIYGKSVGLESARLNAVAQAVIDNSTIPTDPSARFSMYRGPYVPPVCPPIPTAILNGNLPKASTKPICIPQRYEGTGTNRC